MQPPRLQWKPGSLPGWFIATWDGAGPHDGANIHRVAGHSTGGQWRWQVTRNMKTTAGFSDTKQDASDRANEAWRKVMGWVDPPT